VVAFAAFNGPSSNLKFSISLDSPSKPSIHVISFDASDPLIADVKNGSVDVLVVQNPFKMGFDSLKAMVAQLRDGAKASNEDTGVTFVSAQNINDPATQAVLNPSCANAPV